MRDQIREFRVSSLPKSADSGRKHRSGEGYIADREQGYIKDRYREADSRRGIKHSDLFISLPNRDAIEQSFLSGEPSDERHEPTKVNCE